MTPETASANYRSTELPPIDPLLRPEGSGAPWAPWASSAMALVALCLAPVVVAGLARTPRAEHEMSPEVAVALGGLSLLGVAYWVILAVWRHRAWATLASVCRRAASGRPVTPAQAVGYHFVPLYNIVWGFIEPMALAEAYNAVLVQTGSARRVGKTLPVLMGVTSVFGLYGLLLSVPTQIAWMFVVGQAQREYLARTRDLAAPR
ncbi:MAG: hypothetical protein JNK72_20460 [Myxococcales bacterium]|nr:hypothetical protein [Myxococcales bacterium]